MIKQLHIENFRSIKKADLPLGKFTVVTGGNNSGKSSIIYALLTLKNLVNNPNQSLDNFFVYGGLNLGGFSQTVFQKNEELSINIGIDSHKTDYDDSPTSFSVSLNPKESIFKLTVSESVKLKINVSFPYPLNQSTKEVVLIDDSNGQLEISWNGITPTIQVSNDFPKADEFSSDLNKELTRPFDDLRFVEFISNRRGFTKPYYGTVPLQSQITTEDEIATLLATDRELEGKLTHYLKQIIDRIFSVRFTPGTANFYLQTRDKNNAFVADIVNEGLGTNQLVTMLAKILYQKSQFLCMDEPEIHLHPSIINRFVGSLVEIADLEEKQFLLSTHSEQFLAALLRQVAEDKLDPDDLCVYYLTKDKKGVTQIERQEVNERGQIKGGYKSFLDAEMENLQALFQLDKV